ncbi:hypothetical protein SeLEV6574_g05207 [Synchytrium endobioticum]|uniref:Nucleoporin Pom152 n=1 Tax=Synchytrium endobioticum TaxID=286115 RepID=A0A507CVG4_9FUNG|nr:hypothetical protein SeLEV6574_g05207 [Synchytrium endobioticum]
MFDGDAVTWRRGMSGAFVCIQAFKVHQHLAGAEGVTWIWCLLDIIFFVALYWLRIPRLDFSLPVCIVIAISFLVINLSVGSQSALQNGLDHIMGSGRQGHLGVDDVSDENGTHIVGVHTVVVRPPTVAALNPNESAYCLSDTTATVSVPLLIRGSWNVEYMVEYEHQPYSSAQPPTYHNLSVASVDKGDEKQPQSSQHDQPVKKGAKVTRSQLYLSQPGRYRLMRVWEAKPGAGSVLGSTVPGWTDVVACPSAKWAVSEKTRRVDMCVDEKYRLQAELHGAPPFQLRYLQRIARMDSTMTVDVGLPEPTPDSNTDGREGDESYGVILGSNHQQVVINAPQTNIPSKITRSIEMKMDVTAPYFFRILSVTDRFGNIVFYEDASEAAVDVRRGMTVHASTSGDHQLVEVHPRPTVRFTDTDAFKLLRLPDGGPALSGAALPFVMDGSAPFTVTYRKDESAPLTMSDIRKSLSHLPVTGSGTYELLSVKDTFCNGLLLLPSQRSVVDVLPPRITIAAEAITERCVGEVGALVNLTFSGDPPFKLDYEEIQLDTGNRERHIHESHKPRSTLSLRPPVSGRWRYEWLAVSDAHYKDVQISGQHKPFSQVVHPRSSAHFAESNKEVRCIGDNVKVRVDLGGSGPWELTYAMSTGGSAVPSQKRIKVTSSPVYIQTQPFEYSGEFSIDLVEITDSNGCSWPLSVPQTTVQVLAQRPAVSFICPKAIQILEGQHALLPLSLSGRPPYRVKIHHVATGKVFESDRSPVSVRQAGTYEIESVSDAHCTGNVVSPRRCEVSVIPRPSLRFDESQCAHFEKGICYTNDVCESQFSNIHFDIKGKPPFTLDYNHEIELTTKSHPVESKHIDTDKRAVLPLSSIPGRHIYHVTGVRDGNYQVDASRNEVQVVHVVKPRPKASLGHAPIRIFRCAHQGPTTNVLEPSNGHSTTDKDASLMIDLQGEPPFSLTLKIKQDGLQPYELPINNITVASYALPLTRLAQTPGSLTVSLLRVADATGCPREYDAGLIDHQKTIQVTDVAKITSLSSSTVCVGDALVFSLQGVPPFFIKYTLGNKTLLEQESQPLFTISAKNPGNLVITEVCNRAEGSNQVERCCPVSLAHTVHDIPSVRIDGGHATIDDIQEGGSSLITFDFKGTPPFNITKERIGSSPLRINFARTPPKRDESPKAQVHMTKG